MLIHQFSYTDGAGAQVTLLTCVRPSYEVLSNLKLVTPPTIKFFSTPLHVPFEAS